MHHLGLNLHLLLGELRLEKLRRAVLVVVLIMSHHSLLLLLEVLLRLSMLRRQRIWLLLLMLLCNELSPRAGLLLRRQGLFPKVSLLPGELLGLLLQWSLFIGSQSYRRGAAGRQLCGLPGCLRHLASGCVPLLLVLWSLLANLIRRLRRKGAALIGDVAEGCSARNWLNMFPHCALCFLSCRARVAGSIVC